jgi:D-alanyl-D-alanine carboxypeptidase
MRKWTPQELVDIATGHPSTFAPGAGWSYSNTNYVLLGMVVQKLSGMPLSEVIRARLLQPLKLDHTFFDGEETVVGELGHGFDVTVSDVTNKFDQSWAWAAGAMVSSTEDLLSWSQQLYGGHVLQPASLTLMTTFVDTGNKSLPGYGLGVVREDAANTVVTTWGHAGDTDGYHSEMFYLVDTGQTVVAVVNQDGTMAVSALRAAIRKLLAR